MAYPCDKCFHNFNCSLASVAACNCCEDGSWFESVRNTETEEEGEEPPQLFQPLAHRPGERNLQNKQFLAIFLCKMTNKKS